MLNNKIFSLLIFMSMRVCMISATDYVDLQAYEGRTFQKPQQGVLESLFANEWNSFKSSVNESVFTDHISTEQFWNALRESLQDGTFYNRAANYRAGDNQTGSDLFLKTIYAHVVQTPVKYRSISPTGDSITLSGKIFLPKNKNAKNIIIANHYTICANSEAPSQSPSIEGIFATKGYIVIMPDYVGYGISDSLPHPYLHLKSTVTSAIDLLNAAIPYLSANAYSYYSNIILVGYSQGAAATLALQKELEEHYADKFPLQCVYAGAGPYNLTGTFDYYVSNRTTDIACTLPMLFIGMNYGENLGLRREDFFTPLLMKKCPYWIDSKKKNMLEVNSELGNQIDLLLKPVVFQPDSFPTSVLYNAIQRNNIFQWKPRAQLYLFHSTNDNMVPFLNSQTVAEQFRSAELDNVSYDFAPYGNHMKAAVTFFEKVYKML